MVKIETASTEVHSKVELDNLYRIIVKGYELTESEIWGEKYVRVFRPDYDLLLQKNEILLAKYNEQIVGGIHHYKIDESTHTFSLLATDFNFAGKGIGSALIQEVESIAKQRGASEIKMEVLRARGIDTKSKLRLDAFYKRLGYSYTYSKDCACKIPAEKYKKLKVPSDFDFYRKDL